MAPGGNTGTRWRVREALRVGRAAGGSAGPGAPRGASYDLAYPGCGGPRSGSRLWSAGRIPAMLSLPIGPACDRKSPAAPGLPYSGYGRPRRVRSRPATTTVAPEGGGDVQLGSHDFRDLLNQHVPRDATADTP
jgi:hypothetical protein